METAEGETRGGQDKQKVFVVIRVWENIVKAQMLETSIVRRNGAPSRKGCVANGQMTKASSCLLYTSPSPRD